MAADAIECTGAAPSCQRMVSPSGGSAHCPSAHFLLFSMGYRIHSTMGANRSRRGRWMQRLRVEQLSQCSLILVANQSSADNNVALAA